MKFRAKITLSMICLLSILFGVGTSVIISFSFQASLNREQESALSSYQELRNTLSFVSQINIWKDAGDIADTLKQLYEQSELAPSALRLSTQKESVYELGAATAYLESSFSESDADKCTLYIFEAKRKQYLQISGILQIPDETLHLDAAYDISSVYEMRYQQQGIYYRVFLAMIVFCAVLAYSVSRLLTKPLFKLSKASREIAGGNLQYRSRINTNDEIGSFSRDFDSMADQVEASMIDMQRAMARQERFMSSFAHELKNPMTSILGYAELIRNQTLTPNEQADAANFIISEGKRLESLSLKLLDIFVTGEQSVQFAAASPASLVGEIVSKLRLSYSELDITLIHQCEKGICMLEPDLVKSLLINLIDNARKALDHGGEIRITSNMTYDGCCICVHDNGRGIPPQSLAHLTEAFYRVDKSRSRELGGAGLGLTLCLKIADLHNGTMSFESLEGEGTCVLVTLRGGRP